VPYCVGHAHAGGGKFANVLSSIKRRLGQDAAPPEGADIFISYASDDRAKARELAAFLEAAGYSVWWDTSLLSGDKFREVIMRQLDGAQVAVVMWSERSVRSEWVQAEADRALAGGKLIAVKDSGLSHDRIPMPFGNRHITDLNQRPELLAAIEAHLAKAPSTPPVWKTLRFELLSWASIVGASITFAVHLEGFIRLSRITRYLLDNWTSLLFLIWRNILFFVPRLAKTDAVVLSIFAFTAATLFLSPVTEAKEDRKPSHRAELTTALSFAVLLAMLSLGILGSIEDRGILYDAASRIAAAFGVDLDRLDSPQKALWVIGLMVGVLGAILAAVIGANAIANLRARPSHEANVAAVSSRLHRIVIGVLCIIVLAAVADAIATWLQPLLQTAP
jgi:hypothetical protein